MEDQLRNAQQKMSEASKDLASAWLNQLLRGFCDDEVIKQFWSATMIGNQSRRQASIDPYQILGLEKTDSDEKVKKRFRDFAVMLHPDTAKVEGTEFFFQMANAAYQMIKKERGWR